MCESHCCIVLIYNDYSMELEDEEIYLYNNETNETTYLMCYIRPFFNHLLTVLSLTRTLMHKLPSLRFLTPTKKTILRISLRIRRRLQKKLEMHVQLQCVVEGKSIYCIQNAHQSLWLPCLL